MKKILLNPSPLIAGSLFILRVWLGIVMIRHSYPVIFQGGMADYIGWIDVKQCLAINEKTFQNMQKNCAYALELSDVAIAKEHFVPIVMGSTLPICDGLNFK